MIVTGVGVGLGRECVDAGAPRGRQRRHRGPHPGEARRRRGRARPDGRAPRRAGRPTSPTPTPARRSSRRHGALRSVDALVQVAAFEYVCGGLYETDLDDVAPGVRDQRARGPHRPAAGGQGDEGGGRRRRSCSSARSRCSSRRCRRPATRRRRARCSRTMYYLADELGADNIRCNMVVPSWMWGPPVEMFVRRRPSSKGISDEEALQEIVGGFPLAPHDRGRRGRRRRRCSSPPTTPRPSPAST